MVPPLLTNGKVLKGPGRSFPGAFIPGIPFWISCIMFRRSPAECQAENI